jgi:hypothetical protein
MCGHLSCQGSVGPFSHSVDIVFASNSRPASGGIRTPSRPPLEAGQVCTTLDAGEEASHSPRASLESGGSAVRLRQPMPRSELP